MSYHVYKTLGTNRIYSLLYCPLPPRPYPHSLDRISLVRNLMLMQFSKKSNWQLGD